MSESESGAAVLLAIDPGSAKWGLAVVEQSGNCLFREVTPAESAPARVEEILARYPVGEVLLGDRTGSRAAAERLRSLPLPLTLVPEHGTTLLARRLYWRDRPPTGWRKLLPLGLLTPPGPLDAYAAEALALRHLRLLPES